MVDLCLRERGVQVARGGSVSLLIAAAGASSASQLVWAVGVVLFVLFDDPHSTSLLEQLASCLPLLWLLVRVHPRRRPKRALARVVVCCCRIALRIHAI